MVPLATGADLLKVGESPEILIEDGFLELQPGTELLEAGAKRSVPRRSPRDDHAGFWFQFRPGGGPLLESGLMPRGDSAPFRARPWAEFCQDSLYFFQRLLKGLLERGLDYRASHLDTAFASVEPLVFPQWCVVSLVVSRFLRVEVLDKFLEARAALVRVALAYADLLAVVSDELGVFLASASYS